MQQDRLFRLAPEVVSFHAAFVGGEGWQVTIRMRRQGEHWDDAYEAHYSHLTTEELADVVCAEVCAQLQVT